MLAWQTSVFGCVWGGGCTGVKLVFVVFFVGEEEKEERERRVFAFILIIPFKTLRIRSK